MAIPLLRTSERGDYKRCPWMWHHGWEQGLTLRDPKPGAADFGSGLHLCLAEYYKPGKRRGKDPRKTWVEWMKDQHGRYVRIDDLSDPEHDGQAKFEDARELGLAMLEGYLDTYGKDYDLIEEVIAPEQRFRIRIPHPENPLRTIVIYLGTFDLVYRSAVDGRVKIFDSKSTNKNLERYLRDAEWSGQFMGYNAVATATLRNLKLIGEKESVHGFTYNMLRRAMPDTRPIGPDGRRHNAPQKKHFLEALAGVDDWTAEELGKKKIDELESIAAANFIPVFGDVSARQPSPLFMRETITRTAAENKRQINRIGQEALHMRATRSGRLPILKNPTSDCGWQCDFSELCAIDESGDDYEYFRDSVFKKHDPYADHRAGAENSKTSVKNRRRTGVK